MYELTLTVGRIKEEHIQYMVNVLNICADLFTADGGDRSIDMSLERDRDGIERIHQFLPGASTNQEGE